MKALDIIKAMVYDSALAECAQVHGYDHNNETVEDWIASLFGDFHLIDGEIEDGHYLVVWGVDEEKVDTFVTENAQDATLERNNPEEAGEDDQEVWLWRIE